MKQREMEGLAHQSGATNRAAHKSHLPGGRCMGSQCPESHAFAATGTGSGAV